LPVLADYCFIDLIETDGRIVRVEMAHRDPAKDGLLRELRDRYPPNAGNPVRDILAGGPTFLQEHVSEQLIDAIAHDARHRVLLHVLAPVSWLIVPMRTPERTVGAISLVLTAESGRHYSPDDIALAEELGRRAALAVEHAELYAQAQAGIRLRDGFLSVATHELRSPLTVLHGTAQMLLRQRQRSSDLDEREAGQLRRIVAQAARLGQLIDTLLDFSRLHAGQLELTTEYIDLTRLACRVVEEIQPTLAIHSLTCEAPPEGIWIRGDPLRLAQVLYNLVTNAVKYSPAGGPVTVRVARHNQQACLAVLDQGIGIPQEAQGRLFEQFYRADNAQIYAPGLGIGLAVTQEIVARHGGTITVASKEGAGSTFTVCLPLAEARPRGSG
jgi:signal transduction histidine kinase